jgi:hypothetical protein
MNVFFNEYDDEFPEDIEEQFKRFRRGNFVVRNKKQRETLRVLMRLMNLIDYSLSKSKFEVCSCFL